MAWGNKLECRLQPVAFPRREGSYDQVLLLTGLLPLLLLRGALSLLLLLLLVPCRLLLL